MVYIFYTKLNINQSAMYQKWLTALPDSLRELNNKYQKEEDRLRHLSGKILLVEALKRLGYPNYSLDDLYYNEFGKPYISNLFDFNISHSGNLILCAIEQHSKLGIDIEIIKHLELDQYKDTMSYYEWQIINQDTNPLNKFYEFWTMKEAAIKADGRGFSIPLNKIQIISNQTVLIDDTLWYLKRVELDPLYIGFIAISSANKKFEISSICFS